MENKTRIRAILVLVTVMSIIVFSTYSDAVGNSSTQISITKTITETLPSIQGFNFTSPLFLTNFTSDLIIPLGQTFTILQKGTGSANYGIITVSGTLNIQNPLINYGTIINSGIIIISSTFVNMNDSAIFQKTGIVNNTGTIQNSGFVYNDNIINNLGTIINSANFNNCISGLNYSGIINGNAVQGSINSKC